MAISLRFFRKGCVGFIDWLDGLGESTTDIWMTKQHDEQDNNAGRRSAAERDNQARVNPVVRDE
jgi:hypothetical protein